MPYLLKIVNKVGPPFPVRAVFSILEHEHSQEDMFERARDWCRKTLPCYSSQGLDITIEHIVHDPERTEEVVTAWAERDVAQERLRIANKNNAVYRHLLDRVANDWQGQGTDREKMEQLVDEVIDILKEEDDEDR